MSCIEQKLKLEKSLVDTSLNVLGEDITSIYSYGSSNERVNEFSDIDIMMVLKQFPSRLGDIEKVQNLTSLLKRNFDEYNIPLDLHIYGEDEIPTNDTAGYPLFSGFFQVDYLTHRKLLFGEDCLSELPRIDIRRESLNYISRLRRVIRQYIVNPKIDNTMAKALLGLGTLDNHKEIGVEDNKDICGFFRYACTITSKAYLECEGEHYVSKRKNITRFKENLPYLSHKIDFIKGSKQRSNLSNNDVTEYALESLNFMDSIYLLIKGGTK